MSKNKRKSENRPKPTAKPSTYPEFEFVGTADAAFVKLIKKAVAQVSFDSPNFAEWERSIYRMMKVQGWLEAYSLLCRLDEEDVATENRTLPKEWVFTNNLGNQVFLIAGDSLKQYLLKNDVAFNFSGRKVIANFRQLESCRGVLRSPHHPKVVIDGRPFVVGFKEKNNHLIEMLRDRSAKDWATYAGHGQIFHFVYECKHFVGCKVKHDKTHQWVPGISIFEKISPAHWRILKPLDLFLSGLVADDGTGRFVRMGYFPVDVDGAFVNARTFLLPGWRATPEATLYEDNSLSPDLRDRLRKFGEAAKPGHGIFHTDPNLLRFFHEHGFPQVVLGSDPCFSHI